MTLNPQARRPAQLLAQLLAQRLAQLLGLAGLIPFVGLTLALSALAV